MNSKYLLSHCGILICLTLLLISCDGPSGSTSYPSRPVTLIVPWSPGGGTDMSSRTLASVLQKHLGQPVNVVNRTGGGGVVGHLAIAQAQPDGYTIGAITVESTMMHWQGLTDLNYEKFTSLALIMNNYASITVRADAPWNNLDEFLADVRANPGKYQASGTSKGGIWDLARIGFLEAAGLPETAIPWVPSQGAAPALQELIAEGVDVVTVALAEVQAMLKSGQVKVLGVMAPDRLTIFPDIPTIQEQGMDWSLGGWISVGAPAGLPADVRATLDSAIQVTVKDPDYIQAMDQAGFNRQNLNAAACESFWQKQDQINGELLEQAGMKKQ